MLLEISCVILLLSPLFWELYDDRNGDDHGSNDDWILRGLLMLVSSAIVLFIHPNKNFVQAFILSFFMFTALFPWAVNYMHFKRGIAENPKWWDRMSKTAIPDKWDWYSGLMWWQRAIMYAILLGAAIKIYICWETFKSWNACQ